MSKKQKIKWGILGTARIARKRMIKAIQQVEGNICYAIASRIDKRAKEIAEMFNIPKYYGSYDELIEDNKIDAVYIPLPNSLHYQWVIKVAEKGKHILCEKPLSYSVDQVQKMINICEKEDIVLQESYSYFLHPQYEKLFDLLSDEVIGQINLIQIHFSFPAGREHAIRFQHELGGGSLLDLGCYGIDLLHQIFKQSAKHIDTFFNIKNKVDMEFLGILKFDSNVEAIIRTSFLQERQQSILISGKKGSIYMPDAFIPSGNKTYFFIKSNDNYQIEEMDNVDQYCLLVQEFRNKILYRKSLRSDYDRYERNTKTLEELLKIREQ